jgi:hypothetical protein
MESDAWVCRLQMHRERVLVRLTNAIDAQHDGGTVSARDVERMLLCGLFLAPGEGRRPRSLDLGGLRWPRRRVRGVALRTSPNGGEVRLDDH